MKILFIGHSTVKVEIANIPILIDPYFGNAAGPFKRTNPLKLNVKDILPIELVLVSHTHPDHFDKTALSEINKDIPLLIPEDQKNKALEVGFKNVKGMKPWQEYRINEIKISATPALHMKNTVGYIVQSKKDTLYFAGDTIFFNGFKEIAKKFRNITVALLPVDGGKLLFKKTTMAPDQALEAVKILNPIYTIPIHCGNTPRIPIVKKTGDPHTFFKLAKELEHKSKIKILKENETFEV